MKTKIIMLALLCTACAEKPLTNQETQNLLSQYTWGYTAPNSDTPIKLTFKDNQLSAYASCNSMGGAYKIIEQKMLAPIIFGDAQACAPHIMQQEHFIRMFFLQPVPFKISSRSSQNPKLIFQKDQQEYIFVGTKRSHENAHGE
ncbi:META domain-containing protein [Acinetobacter wuhouensis]|uniref:META domain-containing protein n=1 Tax=Acinetobacter wuhouensis TaxID=1879050 RepID=A0A3G2T4E5_9GAMM|nr:META domain-containing protein [Acinetobacter wuhouensis]AYO55119.1 META domain-containing protein [Acinetobacter wuhouensis]